MKIKRGDMFYADLSPVSRIRARWDKACFNYTK